MFCQNCGTKNNDASIFCESCGAKLEKPVAPQATQQPVQPTQQPVQPVQPMQQLKPRKPIPKLAIAIAVEAVVLVAMIVVFFKVGNSVYGPEKVAEKFFVEVANQNFKEAYKVLDVEENDFVNEKAFENASCNVELSKVTDYTIKKTRGSDDEKEVEITYKTKGSSSKRSYDISINKQKDKNMLFFEDWQVSPESMLVEDFQVIVPAGAEVTVDGVKLGKEYKDKSYDDEDESLQYFLIPEMFAGEHQVVVTQEGMAEVRKLVSVYDSYGGYYLYEMYPDEETMKAALETAMDDFEAIYTAAAAGEDFEAVADLFSTQEDRQEDAKEDYESLRDNLNNEDGYRVVNKVAFSNLEGSAYEGYVDEDELCMEVCLDYDYVVEYTEEWFGEVTNETYENSDYMYIDLVYEDGEWLLVSFYGYLYY